MSFQHVGYFQQVISFSVSHRLRWRVCYYRSHMEISQIRKGISKGLRMIFPWQRANKSFSIDFTAELLQFIHFYSSLFPYKIIIARFSSSSSSFHFAIKLTTKGQGERCTEPICNVFRSIGWIMKPPFIALINGWEIVGSFLPAVRRDDTRNNKLHATTLMHRCDPSG